MLSCYSLFMKRQFPLLLLMPWYLETKQKSRLGLYQTFWHNRMAPNFTRPTQIGVSSDLRRPDSIALMIQKQKDFQIKDTGLIIIIHSFWKHCFDTFSTCNISQNMNLQLRFWCILNNCCSKALIIALRNIGVAWTYYVVCIYHYNHKVSTDGGRATDIFVIELGHQWFR